MSTRKHTMMRLTSLAAAGRLKGILIKDFSEPMSSQIIKHALDKHGMSAKSFNNSGKAKVINEIVSDYRAIKPIGSDSAVQLKKNLCLALK